MIDQAKLGGRYTCFQCATKFYDLNRPIPSCPECGTDQREAPVRDMKSLLSSKGTRRKKVVEEPPPPVAKKEDENEGDEFGLDSPDDQSDDEDDDDLN